MYPLRKRACLRCCCFRHKPVTIRKSHVIAAIWLIGIAISAPEYLMNRLEPFEYNNQCYFECRSWWPDSISDLYTVFIFSCTFAIPLTVLSFLYARIGLKLWRRQMPGNVDINRDLTMQTTRIKVIKMLFVVVILFAIFWLPLQTFSMIMFLYPKIRQGCDYQSTCYNIFVGTYFFFHWLSMFHSCLNPLIYCFMNDKFRTDLHDLLCNRGKANHHPWLPTINKTSSTYASASTSSSRRRQSLRELNHNSVNRRHLSAKYPSEIQTSSRRSEHGQDRAELVYVHSSVLCRYGASGNCSMATMTTTTTALTDIMSQPPPPDQSLAPQQINVTGQRCIQTEQQDGATSRVLPPVDSPTTKSDRHQISSSSSPLAMTKSCARPRRMSADPDFVRIVSLPAQTNNNRHGFQPNKSNSSRGGSVLIKQCSQPEAHGRPSIN